MSHKINWIGSSTSVTHKLTEIEIKNLLASLQPGQESNDHGNAFRRYLTPSEFEYIKDKENFEDYFFVEMDLAGNHRNNCTFQRKGYYTVIFATDEETAENYKEAESIWSR